MPGDIWIIDTSSILEIRRASSGISNTRLPRVYKQLGDLVSQDVLVFPKQVLDELERQTAAIARKGPRRDLPYEWAEQNETNATRFGTDYEALRAVLAVPSVENLLDPDARGVEAADPYVLALAYSLNQQGYAARVVTEDRNNGPDKIALASACGIVNVAQLRVGAFLLHKGIWPAK